MSRHIATIAQWACVLACTLTCGDVLFAQFDARCEETCAIDADCEVALPCTLIEKRCSNWNLGGWISGGITVNDHGNRTGIGNAPLPLNQVADGAVMNQLWFYAQKPLDLDSYIYDWGFRIDYVFGTDAPDSQADGDAGWDFGWKTSRDYGSAIPQLYVEAGAGDLEFTFGYLFSAQGYEYTESANNFFYSHNYAFGYGTPGTLAGFMFDYTLNEQWSLNVGWSLGWDSWWSNYLDASTALAGITWTISEYTNISYQMSAGDFGDGTAKNGASSNAGDIYSHAIVLETKLSAATMYVLEHTLGSNTGADVDENQWFSITNYLFHDINDCWSVGARLEWFRDDDGRAVDVNGAGAGSYYEATLGANWTPATNFRLRPEIRVDWFDGVGLPFDSRDGGMMGTASSQMTVGFDAILKF